MEVDRELTDTINKLELFTDTLDSHLKNKPFLNYDDDSSCQPPTLVEADSTDSSVSSAGNATLATYESFETEVEEPRYNYHGPKIVFPKHECPVNICTAETIGAVKSR